MLDHNGKPMKGARVVVGTPAAMTVENGQIEEGPVPQGNPVVTGADGRFRVTGVGEETGSGRAGSASAGLGPRLCQARTQTKN